MALYEEMYKYLESTYEATLSTAIQIMKDHGRGLPGISNIYHRALFDKSPSEYPFIFRLAYELNGGRFRRVLRIAAAIHLLQTSTFVFDDILDRSGKRAGARTVSAEWGVDDAIIAGQILQSLALSEIAAITARFRLPNSLICVKLLTLAMADVYKGQYLDLLFTGESSVSVKQYYEMTFLTTGQFLARVAWVGGLLSDLSPFEQRSLYAFGMNYGMALQICDDIVDVTFSSKDTEKDFAVDIKMRRMRLPLILALRTATAGQKLVLRKYLSRSSRLEECKVREIARAIKTCGATECCRNIMDSFINEAVGSLQSLPESESRRHLTHVALDLENILEGA
jgi:geranylgeranyl pyrophosphate synthase